MIRDSGPCDTGLIDAFLSGDLDDNGERQLADHLDVCAQCRQSLEVCSADAAVWKETGELLKAQPFDAESCVDLSLQSDDSLDETSPPPLSIRNVLEALGPTDDPNMLGRVGGYEVMGVVGAGGMGVVLKGFDRSLDRTVAIKVLAPHLASSGAARKRFAREAKAAAAVLHPNVIAIHGVSDGAETTMLPYLVMPYVRGSSLQARIDKNGPLTLAETLRVAAQIVDGLAAAHAQGLVHRDIKPANILLEEGIERVSITDFGLARAADDATLTHSGVIAGTPQYMSPEQARGEPIDGRSDLFSLGSVMYTMCTGRDPFRAETSFGILRRITDDSPRPIRDINPDVPPWLCRLIQKLHAKSADDRYQSAASVSEVLRQCLAHVQTSEARLPKELRWPFEIRSLVRYGMIAGGCGLLIAGVIWFALTQNPDPTTLPQTLPSISEPAPIPQFETSWSDETEWSLESVQNWIDELDVQTEEAFDVKPDLPTTP
jgi:serine/threonine protein kinase